jgi:hypothetical protein
MNHYKIKLFILTVSLFCVGLVFYLRDVPVNAQDKKTAAALAPVDTSPQTLPFYQDWSNTGLITANDDWSGVPGIIGYQGDGLTGGTGVDPQTIVADGSGTTVDVIANQTNPNTLTAGGVAEFDGIADPTIALQGSGTADVPHIVITVNTFGHKNIKVSYLLRDLDGSGDDAVMPVALQYRVGTTGDYTNIPEGFVADAASGPSTATQTNFVSATLPAAADNEPVVQIRVITANAAGSDEWVGIDNISVAASLIISEFRLRGLNGANDEFVEIYNPHDAPFTIQPSDVSAGYALRASDGVARCVIPTGTVMPPRGHYLCTNSVAYSLFAYPSGNGTTATGDATFTTDIPDNAGIALFNSATVTNLAGRLDAVGSTSEANTLYKEGAGYPALTPFSINYSFYRDEMTIGTNIAQPDNGCNAFPKDTGLNAQDFLFVDTNGTSAGAGQRLGSPGPQNLSSPLGPTNGSAGFGRTLLDPSQLIGAPPNFVRDFTSDPANNSTFGTIDLRRTFTNNTGVPITRLRYRVTNQSTFPSPSGTADLRGRTSGPVVVAITGANPACPGMSCMVQGTTLEQPPNQFNGSGFNGSLSAGTVTLGTPLAPGASINLRFLFGIQQTGSFSLAFNIESLPTGSQAANWVVNGGTDASTNGFNELCAAPTAAAASIQGRAVNAQGRAVYRAIVYLTDGKGESRTVVTNPFGYFRFPDVAVGETYFLNVSHRQYRFDPQVLTVTDDISGLEVIARE